MSGGEGCFLFVWEGEEKGAGSLARATARPETTLQVLAAAGLVRVGPWGETPHGGHQVNCRIIWSEV